jgi:hypothetical protein
MNSLAILIQHIFKKATFAEILKVYTFNSIYDVVSFKKGLTEFMLYSFEFNTLYKAIFTIRLIQINIIDTNDYSF